MFILSKFFTTLKLLLLYEDSRKQFYITLTDNKTDCIEMFLGYKCSTLWKMGHLTFEKQCFKI